ncbi:ABC transporter permease subunit [Castellaniella ginsengisoli]|uniref:ABC transporter permease subunit n=1 Tax=Castellaniella ginsengisoli TaxID=546114 RepID=A0AB39DH27_9BURK
MPDSRQSRALSWTLTALVGFLVLCPVLTLLLDSLSRAPGAADPFTLSPYVRAYTAPALRGVALNTAVFVLGSSLLSTLLALLLACLNTGHAARRLCMAFSILPLMTPPLLFAAGWALLLHPGDGLLAQALQGLLGLEPAPFDIHSLGGMILVEGMMNLPMAYLIIAPALAAFDPARQEAARVSGSGPTDVLLRITLPILYPALLAALVLSMVRSLASYAVPRVLGAPGHVDVLTTYLYGMISAGSASDEAQAAALGLGLLSASLALTVFYRALVAESAAYAAPPAHGARPGPARPGRMRHTLGLGAGLLYLLATALPVLALLYASLIPRPIPLGALAFAALDLQHWIDVFQEPAVLRALRNSLLLAGAGATLGAALSLGVACVCVKTHGPPTRLLRMLSFLPFAFPALVLGIGFKGFFAQIPPHATLAALLLAYIAVYLPYGVRPLAGAFTQIHRLLDEASRLCGAGRLTTLRRITLPLLIPGFVSAWTLMAILFLNELPVSVVLSDAGAEVLSTRILSDIDEGRRGRLSALGLLAIALSMALALCARVATRAFRRRQES